MALMRNKECANDNEMLPNCHLLKRTGGVLFCDRKFYFYLDRYVVKMNRFLKELQE